MMQQPVVNVHHSTTILVPYIFFLLGIGVLVPWNVFISLKNYYEIRFCNTTTSTTSSSSSTATATATTTTRNIESIFATTYNISSIITMILLISIRVLRDHYYYHHPKHSNIVVQNDDDDDGYNDVIRSHSNNNTVTQYYSDNRVMELPVSHNNNNNHHHHHPIITNDDDDDDHNCNVHEEDHAISLSRIDDNSLILNKPSTYDYYSLFFVIIPSFITILVFVVQLILVLYINNDDTSYMKEWFPFQKRTKMNMYNITILAIATCGITSALLGTGLITVITNISSTSSSSTNSNTIYIPIDQTMNPYQYGISMAGVVVSVINVVIAMTKDPIVYYTNHCTKSKYDDDFSSSTSSLLSSERSPTVELYQYSINSITSFDRVVVVVVEQQQSSSTCQSYNTIDYAVFGYFIIAILILLLCLFGFLYIQQQILIVPTTPHRILNTLVSCDDDDDDTTLPSSTTTLTQSYQQQHHSILQHHNIDNCTDLSGLYHRPLSLSTTSTNEMNQLMTISTTTDDALVTTPAITSSTSVAAFATSVSSSSSSASFLHVFSSVYGPTGAIFITFAITLGLFPSWTSELRSIYACQDYFDDNRSISSLLTRYANDLYIPLTFVLFNIGDLSGRLLSTVSQFQMTVATTTSSASTVSKKLLFLSSIRFVFFPLFFLCPTSTDTVMLGFTVRSDLYSILIQLLFAMTNGYIIATSFALAPSLLLLLKTAPHDMEGPLPSPLPPQQQSQQELMSEILSCAVNFGLFSGSVLSLLVTHWTSQVQ